MKGYYCLIIMLLTVCTLAYSLPATNQNEEKSVNVLRSIIKTITREKYIPDPRDVPRGHAQPDPDPGLLGAALGCSHIPVFGCIIGAVLPI